MTDLGHDPIFHAMVHRAVEAVVEFNIAQGEEEPDDEEREWCADLTRQVFEAIGLQELLDAGECMADQGVLGCIGWDRALEPFKEGDVDAR